jgi:hypothetical protein
MGRPKAGMHAKHNVKLGEQIVGELDDLFVGWKGHSGPPIGKLYFIGCRFQEYQVIALQTGGHVELWQAAVLAGGSAPQCRQVDAKCPFCAISIREFDITAPP